MARAWCEIPLGGKRSAGRVALVDVDDYEAVIRHRWHVSERRHGRHTYGPYAVTTPRRGESGVSLHQFIAGASQDHVNRDGLDNRRSNLRLATRRQNQCNRSAWGRSRYRGVSRHNPSGRWQARVVRGGRRCRLGLFDDEEDAARAYDSAAQAEYGEFACLNFPAQER